MYVRYIGKKREDYLAEGEKGWGIAYGISPEEIEFAQRTQKELYEQIDSFDAHNHENVHKFLAYCKEHFQERMDDDISW